MKTILTICLSLSLLQCAQAQTSDGASQHKTIFKDLNAAYGIVDVTYSQPSINSTALPGMGILFGAVLNDFWVAGLHIDFSSTSKLSMGNPPVEVVNPRYNYLFAGLHNEFLIAPESVVSLSFPIKIGMGNVTYTDRYYEGISSARLDQETFFVAEPGVKMNVNLWKHVGFTAGAGYRITAGVDRAGSESDFNQAVYHVGLRCKFWE